VSLIIVVVQPDEVRVGWNQLTGKGFFLRMRGFTFEVRRKLTKVGAGEMEPPN